MLVTSVNTPSVPFSSIAQPKIGPPNLPVRIGPGPTRRPATACFAVGAIGGPCDRAHPEANTTAVSKANLLALDPVTLNLQSAAAELVSMFAVRSEETLDLQRRSERLSRYGMRNGTCWESAPGAPRESRALLRGRCETLVSPRLRD